MNEAIKAITVKYSQRKETGRDSTVNRIVDEATRWADSDIDWNNTDKETIKKAITGMNSVINSDIAKKIEE